MWRRFVTNKRTEGRVQPVVSECPAAFDCAALSPPICGSALRTRQVWTAPIWRSLPAPD